MLTDMKGKASGNKSFTDSKLFLYSAVSSLNLHGGFYESVL